MIGQLMQEKELVRVTNAEHPLFKHILEIRGFGIWINFLDLPGQPRGVYENKSVIFAASRFQPDEIITLNASSVEAYKTCQYKQRHARMQKNPRNPAWQPRLLHPLPSNPLERLVRV